MKISCPLCSEQKKIKKHGTYPIVNGGQTKHVRRYFCRGCGNSFSEHTFVEVIREKPNDRPVIKRKPSDYLRKKRNRKSNEVYSDIQRYITNHGLPLVKDITDSEAISPKTYYKYLRSVSLNMVGDFLKNRKDLKLRKLALIEFSQKHEKLGFKIRFLLLVDLQTRCIYNIFFHEKRKQKIMSGAYNEASFEWKSERNFVFRYNTEHIVQHLANLKKKYSGLIVYLRCSERLKEKLMCSGAYKVAPKKLVEKYISDLMDFGFGKVLRLTLSLRGGNKRYFSEATKRSILKSYTNETLLKVVSLYNTHQLERFNTRDENNRKIKPKHRRLSNRKRPHHRVKKAKK